MKYLKIQNKGELDIRLVALMGGTTKSKDEFKIGQWGSGLKYTLAYLLKTNTDFKIFAGEKNIDISVETETIRDEDFDIVCIDGKRTSITTQMGGNAWSAWTIIREIWCNALDEGEPLKEITDQISGRSGYTTFYIQVTSEVKNVLDNWDNYFIHDHEPISETKTHKIYPGGAKLRLYKQGVLIHESDGDYPSLFCYDIKNADINELREFRGSITKEIYLALKDANEKAITYFIENVTDKHYEGDMDLTGWSFLGNFAEAWNKTIGNAKIVHQKAVDDIKTKGLNIDLAGIIIVPKKVYAVLSSQFKGIGALRVADKNNDFFEIIDEELSLIVKQAMVILESCNYFIHPELSFIFGVFGDKNTLATVNLDEKVIYISEQMKHKSLFEFVAMLIEENEHFNTGFSDETRAFQQHFINLYTKTLLNKHEVKL
jgi:hypothetical protein